MKPFQAIACPLCLFLLAGWATAQTGESVGRADLSPEARMNMAVSTYVFDSLGSYKDLMEPTDILKLAMIAKFKAIALTCEGFEIDEARYTAAMQGLVGRLMTPSPGETGGRPTVNLPFTIAMSGYSTLLGGNLAVAAYDPDAMCALGARLRTQMVEDGAKELLIWKDPE